MSESRSLKIDGLKIERVQKSAIESEDAETMSFQMLKLMNNFHLNYASINQ